MEHRSKIFRFKQFSVLNDRAAMKVNTDGVLLAAVAQLPSPQVLQNNEEEKHKLKILDIGTGTGVIALILAQRLKQMDACKDFSIEAIDIDKASAEEAKINFENSPWYEHLAVENISLQEFIKRNNYSSYSEEKNIYCSENQSAIILNSPPCFDLIISNPPYFFNDLNCPNKRKNLARHCNDLSDEKNTIPPSCCSLSYKEILNFAANALSERGSVALILPYEEEKELLNYAKFRDLRCLRKIYVKSFPHKKIMRIIAEFTRENSLLEEKSSFHSTEEDITKKIGDTRVELLTIHKEDASYSEEYKRTVKDFYL